MSATDNLRPNIRIEITNNLRESMEVDEVNEEGEISDDNEDLTYNQPESNDQLSPKSIFLTGKQLFDKEEKKKLAERANRFCFDNEQTNFTYEHLQILFSSLGINQTNHEDVRFNAVCLQGISKMSAEDILDYFKNFTPDAIEWISTDSCNIVFLTELSAARALHFQSEAVKGMPARASMPASKEFLDDDDESEGTGRSILLSDRTVELKHDDESMEEIATKNITYNVDISDIKVPIPPGYWRLGKSHPKSKSLLLRYALKTDIQPVRIEKLNKFYKKNLNPTRFGLTSRSSQEQQSALRPQNKGKMLWGVLAENWDEDYKFREREYLQEPKLEIKNPNILVRLGAKRKPNLEDEESDEDKKKSKVPRMRMYADEEEEKMKRRQILNKIKQTADKISKNENSKDLRNVLKTSGNKKEEEPIVESIDLGTKLKNRSKKMVFTVEGYSDTAPKTDARSVLDKRRNQKSPVRHRSRSLEQRSPEYERSGERRRRYRGSPSRTMHSDRIRPQRDYEDDEDFYGGKTRSKVAVVIKTPKTPAVASTVWSRVHKPDTSSESESESEKSESGDSGLAVEKIENDETVRIERPGFDKDIRSRLTNKGDHRSPLKIEISNDHFKNK